MAAVLSELDLADLAAMADHGTAADLLELLDPPVCEWLLSLDGETCGKPATWLASASCHCTRYACREHFEQHLAATARVKKWACPSCGAVPITIEWLPL